MKLNINSAKKGNSNYTFSPMSLVTVDFGRLQPINCWSMILGDKFSQVQANGLLRCTPQVFPPFGRMNLKNAAFFVPDSQIYSWSSAFHSDNKLWRGQIADKVPSFYSTDFNGYFVNNYLNGLTTLVSNNPAVPPARNTYDITYPYSGTRTPATTNLSYYRLTPYGWKIYAVFKALGFDFVTFPTDFTNSLTFTSHISSNTTLISAIPFLAYCKIWNDYFCNSYQSDKNVVSDILQKIYLNKDVVISGNTLYTSSSFTVEFSLLLYMIERLPVPYESNMYTNAWNEINDPTGTELLALNQVNTKSLISPAGGNADGEFGSLAALSNGNTHSSKLEVDGITTKFSQLGHRTLQAFDNFVRRRNLVGSKAVQQLYALFGIEPDEWKKDYVVKLCEGSSRINFSAITSQSDTVNGANGKPLGAFAGTGLGGFNMNFGYEANTYGTIICLAWLNIDPIMMHGLSPDVLRIKPLDFYNPDWDGKAYRPIPICEVTGAKSIENDAANAVNTFGYTNMYDDYRTMRDVVAGNFLDDTTRNFAFMRDLTETNNIMETNNFRMHPQSYTVQYWYFNGNSDLTNPFLTLASAGDRFWFCVDWNIKCTRPILSSENSFDLDGEGNLTIKKNGDGMA